MIVYNGCGSYTVFVGDKQLELTESELFEIQNMEIPQSNVYLENLDEKVS